MISSYQIGRVAAVLALVGVAGAALGADVTGEREAALERLEAARVAFEAAKAELEAAQREAAQLTGGEISVVSEREATRRAQPADEQADVPDPEPTSWTKGWTWKAFAGVNGASGNSENFSARLALDGERFTSKYETKLAFSYIYGTSDGNKDTSRGVASLKNDWLIEDSKWRVFGEAKYEYDEFQEWDHRVSAAVGLGYELYQDEDTTLLIGRAGVGGYYEIGEEADEEFVPEGLIGLELRHKLSENAKLNATTTYYPSFDDFGEFRWQTNAGLEVVMDKDSGMTLNTGFEHRHDSEPGDGRKYNDLTYYMGLGWTF